MPHARGRRNLRSDSALEELRLQSMCEAALGSTMDDVSARSRRQSSGLHQMDGRPACVVQSTSLSCLGHHLVEDGLHLFRTFGLRAAVLTVTGGTPIGMETAAQAARWMSDVSSGSARGSLVGMGDEGCGEGTR